MRPLRPDKIVESQKSQGIDRCTIQKGKRAVKNNHTRNQGNRQEADNESVLRGRCDPDEFS